VLAYAFFAMQETIERKEAVISQEQAESYRLREILTRALADDSSLAELRQSMIE
jgi:hypothetical protein